MLSERCITTASSGLAMHADVRRDPDVLHVCDALALFEREADVFA